jgi:hypothetical protein
MACTQSNRCPFATLFTGKPSLRVWTDWYCQGRWGRCARFQSMAAGEVPPSTLLPNGRSLEALTPSQAAC